MCPPPAAGPLAVESGGVGAAAVPADPGLSGYGVACDIGTTTVVCHLLTGLPENKCVIHFENVDLVQAKATIGKTNCITGNFPIYLLEYGTVEQVVEEAKRQIDIGAPGGGFIFKTDASIQVTKRENLMALYDAVRTYGKR